MTVDEALAIVSKVCEACDTECPEELVHHLSGVVILAASQSKGMKSGLAWGSGFTFGYTLRGMIEREEIKL